MNQTWPTNAPTDGSACSRPCGPRPRPCNAGPSTAVVHRTGMGPERSRRAATRIAAVSGPDRPVAIVGVCGALTPDLRPGDVVVASTVSSQNGDVWLELPGADLVAAELARRGIPARVGPILSTEHVVTRGARPRLAASRLARR